jgi:ribosomal protein S18 acetylase RimI-like enzyme
MADVVMLVDTQANELPIRKVDIERDLGQIADLIEICFGDQMDEDGHEYLRQIRRAAKDVRQIMWARGSNEWVAMPMHGYVYEDADQIIGNVTLVPFLKSGKWVYLICNVAVHPEYRRRGIGRLMTVRGMEHIRKQKAQAAWLQVRVDNLPAIHLYESLGFQHRAVRTLWRASIGEQVGKVDERIIIRPQRGSEWPQQRHWLEQTYPETVAWNLPFRSETFSPNWWRRLMYFARAERVESWTAHIDGKLVGGVNWAETQFHQESLWPVAAPEYENAVMESLLNKIRQRIQTHKPVVVNYPEGRAEAGFTQAGFRKINSLIWMELPFA